ncbi:MAG: serine hydrolase [Nitrososphaerota archaeon]|nr:serine hydrolase [Nitrososphaerota archaeon]
MTRFDPRRFDDLVFTKMSETKIPSVAAAVIEDGKVAHSRGYGFKDVAGALPATDQTLYGIGSISKSFVALSIAKLVEEGKMGFHDPVTKFLPLKQRAFEQVEVHHLLSHTSGIPGLGSLEVLLFQAFGDYHHWLPISSFGDLDSFMSDVDDWAESEPGRKYFYLNEGFVLLGEIVSKVSGRPWEKFLKDEIFTPLKMSRSFIQREDISKDKDVAVPYAVRGLKVTPTPVPYGSGAAGGIVSSVADLSNYVQMLINGGEFEGTRVVSRDSLDKMETPYVRGLTEYYGGDSYGYGLRIIPDFRGHKIVGHGGSVDVYTANMEYSRDTKSGVILLANGTGYPLGVVAMSAMTLLLGGQPEELRPVRINSLLKKLEGQYRAYKGTIFAEVRKNGSFLILSGEDIGNNIVLVPDGEEGGVARFYTLDLGARMDVMFRFNEHGVELLYERYRYRRSGPLPPTTESLWRS